MMTPEEFSSIRKELKLSNRQLGKKLGKLHYRTVQRYASPFYNSKIPERIEQIMLGLQNKKREKNEK